MDRQNAADTMYRLCHAQSVLNSIGELTEDPEVADFVKIAHGQVKKAMGICIQILDDPLHANGIQLRLPIH
jgi:hypothetical protein